MTYTMTKKLRDYKDVLRVGDEIEFGMEWWRVCSIYDDFLVLRHKGDGREIDPQWRNRITVTGYRPKKRTLETLEVGDYVGHDHVIRRILMAQGEGKYRTYSTSEVHDKHKDHTIESCEKLKKTAILFTAHEIEEYGYTPYTPEENDEEITLTMDEVAKKFGVAVDKLRIKKNDD